MILFILRMWLFCSKSQRGEKWTTRTTLNMPRSSSCSRPQSAMRLPSSRRGSPCPGTSSLNTRDHRLDIYFFLFSRRIGVSLKLAPTQLKYQFTLCAIHSSQVSFRKESSLMLHFLTNIPIFSLKLNHHFSSGSLLAVESQPDDDAQQRGNVRADGEIVEILYSFLIFIYLFTARQRCGSVHGRRFAAGVHGASPQTRDLLVHLRSLSETSLTPPLVPLSSQNVHIWRFKHEFFYQNQCSIWIERSGWWNYSAIHQIVLSKLVKTFGASSLINVFYLRFSSYLWFNNFISLVSYSSSFSK